MPSLANGKTRVIPTNTYAAGTYNSQNWSLSSTQSVITISMDRNSWPDTGSNVVSISVSISYDGGNTFSFLMGFTAMGGNTINPWTQVVDPESTFTVALPQVGNANREVRATATLFVTLNTSASITVN